jgi:hypothetical protein
MNQSWRELALYVASLLVGAAVATVLLGGWWPFGG